MKILVAVVMIFYLFSGQVSGQDKDCYSLALEKLKRRDYQESIDCFDRILKKNRTNIRVLALRGYAKAQIKDYEGALKDFDLILKLDPGNSDAYNHRGICKQGLGDYEGALADYNRAIELSPLNKEAYSNRGVLKYKYLKDKNGASEDWLVAKSLGSPAASRLLRKYFYDPEGFLPFTKGVILYANYPDLHYTLFVRGKPDLNYYPVVRMDDGRVFEFFYTRKKQFGTGNDEEALNNYLKWETENMNKLYHTQIHVQFEKIFSPVNLPMRFWYYENLTPGKIQNVTVFDIPAQKIYYLNFIYKEYIFSISYPSVSGRDKEAGEFLMGLLDNLTFYEHELNMEKLRKAIKRGRTSYKE